VFINKLRAEVDSVNKLVRGLVPDKTSSGQNPSVLPVKPCPGQLGMFNLGYGPHHRFALGLVHFRFRLSHLSEKTETGSGLVTLIGGIVLRVCPIFRQVYIYIYIKNGGGVTGEF